MDIEYKISVSGSGERLEIAEALRLLADAIDSQHINVRPLNTINGAEWGKCKLSSLFLNSKTVK